jgi:hypothetical protein
MNHPRTQSERTGAVSNPQNDNEQTALLNVIYYRPTHAGCTPLDEKLFDVAAHHRGQLRLVVRHSNECGHLFGGWVSGRAPTVLFVRDGEMLAQMIGDLPRLEIERLVSSALSATQTEGYEPLPRPVRRAS